MTVKKLIFYLATIGVLLIILFFMIFRGPTENDIRLEIKRANYCGSDADCSLVQTKPPFDCKTYVNSGSIEKINDLISEWKSKEDRQCPPPAGASCYQFACLPN